MPLLPPHCQVRTPHNLGLVKTSVLPLTVQVSGVQLPGAGVTALVPRFLIGERRLLADSGR